MTVASLSEKCSAVCFGGGGQEGSRSRPDAVLTMPRGCVPETLLLESPPWYEKQCACINHQRPQENSSYHSWGSFFQREGKKMRLHIQRFDVYFDYRFINFSPDEILVELFVILAEASLGSVIDFRWVQSHRPVWLRLHYTLICTLASKQTTCLFIYFITTKKKNLFAMFLKGHFPLIMWKYSVNWLQWADTLQLCASASQASRRTLSPEGLVDIILNILLSNFKDSRAQSFYLWSSAVLSLRIEWSRRENSCEAAVPQVQWQKNKCTMLYNSSFSRREKQTFLLSPEVQTEMSLTKTTARGFILTLMKKTQFTRKMRAKFKYVTLTNYWLLHKTAIVLSVKSGI